MAITVDVNGVPIQYPQTGDTGWGNNATKFAEEVASVLGKIGQSQAPVNDDIIVSPGNLSVTSGNLSVGGDASITGNTTLTGNITVNGNSNLGNGTSDTTAITGILNVDSGVLYVDPVNNRVGINDTTPSEALDITGNVAITGNETVGGDLGVTGATSLSSTLAVTGDSTLTGNLSVNGNTTLGNASGDSLTINSNGVSIPNGLNFDSNTLVINAANNRVGIGVASPSVPLDIQADGVAFGMDIRGRSSDNIGLIRFLNNAGSPKHRIGLWSNDSFTFQNSNGVEQLTIAQNGQLSAVVPGGSTLYPGYLCRAWVNFNGTLSGTISPRGSANISSVVKNSTGNYTINIDTDMPDGNYSVVSSSSYVAAVGQPSSGIQQGTTPTGASFVLQNIYQTTVRDSEFICVGIFR